VETVVGEVMGQPGTQSRSVKRLTRTQEDDDVVRYLAPTTLSRLRLLMGMVYANRPWRLAAGLSKVMMAAFAAGVVSLAYPTMWQLSDTMGPWRLSAATVLASAAMIAWLILDHKLWERPQSAGVCGLRTCLTPLSQDMLYSLGTFFTSADLGAERESWLSTA
jgi:hypothetical protein